VCPGPAANERWGSFCRGTVPGRSRQVFVDSHLGGRDPGRAADEPVFYLIAGVPVYDAGAGGDRRPLRGLPQYRGH
jgi:hypothetical protein